MWDFGGYKPPTYVFIRSYSNWLDSHSDKVEAPGSSPGLRTTFLALSNNWPSSSPFQGGNTGSSPVGATTFFRCSSVGRAAHS